jgi:hypothetical protein
LHDDRQQIRRQFRGQRWIFCLLEFKGRKRSIMTPGRYTELFFLDEATALAAGHRPCAECQRDRFNQFRESWAKANPELSAEGRPAATALDAALHQERMATGIDQRRFCDSVGNAPDGAFVADDEHNAYLVFRKQLLRWTPAGYVRAPKDGVSLPTTILTPASVLRTLGTGYFAAIHWSALQAIAQTSV